MKDAVVSFKQIAGPKTGVSADDYTKWLDGLASLRKSCHESIHYNGSIFEVDALKWTQPTYMQPQMHPYDRFLYDPKLGNYSVSRYLDDLKARYGGIDSALVWPTYTNIGIDDRSQFDLITSMPGGVEGLKVMVKQMHDAGVKVLWPYK